MSRRASLPKADELFRRTDQREAEDKPASEQEESTSQSVDVATKIQVAEEAKPPRTKEPKHDEKVTYYCTAEQLTRLERARLELRAAHGLSSDRGRIVRAALEEILDEFESRGPNSSLVRRLQDED